MNAAVNLSAQELSLENEKQLDRIAAQAEKFLEDITMLVTEEQTVAYKKTFSATQVKDLPYMTKAKYDRAIQLLEQEGIVFEKNERNHFEFDVEDVAQIYSVLGHKKYRDEYCEPVVISITNLKGGITKSVSGANIAHAMRTKGTLIHRDYRILILDLDPQASMTMLMNGQYAIGEQEKTAVQAILQNVDFETLKKDFILPSDVKNVDVLPASMDDGFVTQDWEKLVREHLKHTTPARALIDTIVKVCAGQYLSLIHISEPTRRLMAWGFG
ncbi:ParA family protein, partial [Vibrio barjaei]|uniref:ParA family protein n=1 Tax=Vibrio barjaei TaxID=1676683 RepID=UPI0022846365